MIKCPKYQRCFKWVVIFGGLADLIWHLLSHHWHPLFVGARMAIFLAGPGHFPLATPLARRLRPQWAKWMIFDCAEFLLVARYVLFMTICVFGGCNNPRRHSEQLLWSCQSLIKLLVEIKIHVLSCSINFGLLGKWWVPTITAFEKYQSLCHHQDNNVRRMLFCFGVFPGCSLQSVCWVRTTRNLPLGYDTLDSPPQMEVEPSERRGLA